MNHSPVPKGTGLYLYGIVFCRDTPPGVSGFRGMKYCLRNMKLLRNEVSFGYEVKFAHHVRQHTSYAQRTSYAKHTSLARRANFIEKPPSRWLGGFSGDPSGTRTPDPLLKRQLLYRLS